MSTAAANDGEQAEPVDQAERAPETGRANLSDNPHSTDAPPPRWVLDTNVLLDWLVFGDPGVIPLVEAITAGQARLVTRPDCRAEFERVLDYPQVVRRGHDRATLLAVYDRWHILSVAPAAAAIAEPGATADGTMCTNLSATTLAVNDSSVLPQPAAAAPSPPLPLCRDPDDQKFLELAQTTGARWLISKDRALLDLARRVRLSQSFEVLDPRQASMRLAASGV